MQLTILGSAGYHPTATRHTPCFLLPEVGVLLDAGTGVFRLPGHLRTRTLDVYLSHAHLDHVVGLTYFLDVVYQHPLDSLRVHGEREKLDAIRLHLFSELLFPSVPRPMEFVPLSLEGEEPAPNNTGGRLRWFPLRHKGGSVGYRFDWPGHSLAYVTDTTAEPGASYIKAIRGVDLLLHECYFPDEYAEYAASKGHSHTSAVARLARAAEVGRLVVCHFNPLAPDDDPIGLDGARSIFPETVLARDEETIDF